jgi:hypothetical protein
MSHLHSTALYQWEARTVRANQNRLPCCDSQMWKNNHILYSGLDIHKNRDSSVGIALGFGVLGLDSRRGLEIFLFTTASRTALGPTQPPIQWVPRALSLGVKRPGSESDHSPPSSAEVKESGELYIHSPNKPPRGGAQLKHRAKFTFIFSNSIIVSRA